MKKIPTLFKRKFEGGKIVGITDEITPGCEEAFLHGTATIKYDGACCAFINGVFYKRYDAKKGKIPPLGAIPCCEPDPVTGHWPHWVKVDFYNPSDKWFKEAYLTIKGTIGPNEYGTFEAVGPHFNGNPYNRTQDSLLRHGAMVITGLDRDFESIKTFLENRNTEGIVFWLDGEPVCKIKRTDFGFEWPLDLEKYCR